MIEVLYTVERGRIQEIAVPEADKSLLRKLLNDIELDRCVGRWLIKNCNILTLERLLGAMSARELALNNSLNIGSIKEQLSKWLGLMIGDQNISALERLLDAVPESRTLFDDLQGENKIDMATKKLLGESRRLRASRKRRHSEELMI